MLPRKLVPFKMAVALDSTKALLTHRQMGTLLSLSDQKMDSPAESEEKGDHLIGSTD